MSERLTLLYLAECVSTHSSKGDLIHVKEVIEVFDRKGHDVTLLIRGKTPPNFFKKHLFTFRLPDFRFPLSIFLYAISTLPIAIEVLVKRPGVIYIRDNGINLGVFIGKIFHKPVFLEINGNLLVEYSIRNKVLALLFMFTMKNSYALADAVIIPSRGQISILKSQKVNQNNIYVIPNGVDPQKFYPQNKIICRKQLKLDENCFYFCFVGNIAPWQGLEYAIIALSLLTKEVRNPNIKLVIVGDGPTRKKLERLVCELNISDRVTFLGTMDQDNISSVINGCDVCIAPFTAWRNKEIGVSPLKLYEYLSCGKPVIASAIQGTEIIDKLDAGILVEPDNVEELKNAFKKAIEMLPYWEKKARLLHKEITENHSWDRRVNDILQIMHRISKKSCALISPE